MGRTNAKDHDATVQTKNRTKILIDNFAPTILKREILRLVALEYHKDKADEKVPYNLILEGALEQQHYFLMTIEDKQSGLHKAQNLSVASLIPIMLRFS